jgi:hypothetical protein
MVVQIVQMLPVLHKYSIHPSGGEVASKVLELLLLSF